MLDYFCIFASYYELKQLYDYNINKYGNIVNGEVMPINTCSNDVYDLARNSDL